MVKSNYAKRRIAAYNKGFEAGKAETLENAKSAAEPAIVSPLLGVRFKLAFNKAGNCISFRKDQADTLFGQWVWLVDATDGMSSPLFTIEAPHPQELADNPLRDFFEKVDEWGAAEWFDRAARAIREQDKAVISKDEVAFEIHRMIAASSLMRLVREHENAVRSALAAHQRQPAEDNFFRDVVNLVIAAREFWDINNDLSDESRALDKALEAFTDRVPYENQPDDQEVGQ